MYRTYKSKCIDRKVKVFKNGKSLSEDDLLEILRQSFIDNNKIPEMRDFINNPKYPSSYVYPSIFGSWNTAITKSGLEQFCFNDTENEELLGSLMQFFEENGRSPIYKDLINNARYPSFNIYVKRFESLNNALKLVMLDKDTLIKKGSLRNTCDKGRLWELKVLEHLGKKTIDLSGENFADPFDGICPQGHKYDAKSSKLYEEQQCYSFHFKKVVKECWYYLGGFNINYEELEYVWRIPGYIIEVLLEEKGRTLSIGLLTSYAYNITNMKEYDITDKFYI